MHRKIFIYIYILHVHIIALLHYYVLFGLGQTTFHYPSTFTFYTDEAEADLNLVESFMFSSSSDNRNCILTRWHLCLRFSRGIIFRWKFAASWKHECQESALLWKISHSLSGIYKLERAKCLIPPTSSCHNEHHTVALIATFHWLTFLLRKAVLQAWIRVKHLRQTGFK